MTYPHRSIYEYLWRPLFLLARSDKPSVTAMQRTEECIFIKIELKNIVLSGKLARKDQTLCDSVNVTAGPQRTVG